MELTLAIVAVSGLATALCMMIWRWPKSDPQLLRELIGTMTDAFNSGFDQGKAVAPRGARAIRKPTAQPKGEPLFDAPPPWLAEQTDLSDLDGEEKNRG